MSGDAQRQASTGASYSPELADRVRQAQGQYQLRLARPDELEQVFALRFRVFNLELDEGLAASYLSGLDEDGFDRQCHHLIVETDEGEIIGPYRMQDRRMARRGQGFYSAAEFDIEQLGDEILDHAVELGRACIQAEHRNTRVLYLLWRGLAAYMLTNQHRWFFGCCSLTSQNPLDGQRLMRALRDNGSTDVAHWADVMPDYACLADDDGDRAPKIPKLMRLYLSYGARIAGGPALDREFGTIDYLALFDIDALSDAHRRMFLDPA